MGCVTFAWQGPAGRKDTYEATMFFWYCDRCGSWDLGSKFVPKGTRMVEKRPSRGLKILGVLLGTLALLTFVGVVIGLAVSPDAGPTTFLGRAALSVVPGSPGLVLSSYQNCDRARGRALARVPRLRVRVHT
jgi:hypothetical protein